MIYEEPEFKKEAAKPEKKEEALESLNDEELKELKELTGPSWEDVEGRIKFDQEKAKLSKEDLAQQLERRKELDKRRMAEIKKFEWESPTTRLEEETYNPEGFKKREEEIRAEWKKLSPEEQEEQKERLRKLRYFQYPEVWEKKGES